MLPECLETLRAAMRGEGDVAAAQEAPRVDPGQAGQPVTHSCPLAGAFSALKSVLN